MRSALLAYRMAIGLVLSAIAATVTVVIFESVFELSVYISIPVGALAYVTMLVMWFRFLDFLALQTRR